MDFETMEEIITGTQKSGYSFFDSYTRENSKHKVISDKPMKGRFFIVQDYSPGSETYYFRICFALKNYKIHFCCPRKEFKTEKDAMGFFNEFPENIVKGIDFLFQLYFDNDYGEMEKHFYDKKREYYSIFHYIYKNQEKLNLEFIFK